MKITEQSKKGMSIVSSHIHIAYTMQGDESKLTAVHGQIFKDGSSAGYLSCDLSNESMSASFQSGVSTSFDEKRLIFEQFLKDTELLIAGENTGVATVIEEDPGPDE
jgi:hypothetical protein